MDRALNSLLLKSNRALGTRLVESDLVSMKEIDAANDIFIHKVHGVDPLQASLLQILLFDKQSLKEPALIEYQITRHRIGALSLESYQLLPDIAEGISFEMMRATWTLPFDRMGDSTLLASTYYMSDVVKAFWEEHVPGRLIWYVVPFNQLQSTFELWRQQKTAKTD